MNYAEIKECDIANGPGVRLTLFVSGCTHHCPECFNPETWDFNYGEPFTEEVQDKMIEILKDESYQGLTLLGGEPMEMANQKALLPFLERVKRECPEKDVWCFTGYLYDQDILGHFAKIMPETMKILALIDVLVDGEFEIALKDITLLYKGSSNQRTIDVKKSLKENKIVLWNPGSVSMLPNAKI